MKRMIKATTGIVPLSIAIVLWYGSLMLKEFSFKLIYWVHESLLKKGNSIETEAALLVALFYAIVTYVVVILLITTSTRFAYKKPFFECMKHQLYRYFAFFGMLPLVILGDSWEILYPFLPAKSTFYRLPIPTIKPILDISSAFCETVLFLSVIIALASAISFAYGILVNSNIYFNRVCAALWIVYAYFSAYIIAPYFEYGKWFLLFVAGCYIIGTIFFIARKKEKDNVWMPKYEVLIIPLDEGTNDIKIEIDEDKAYDFSMFMPKEKGENDE